MDAVFGGLSATALGPVLSESIVLQHWQRRWLVVDSCFGTDGRSATLEYLGVSNCLATLATCATTWS